MNVITVSNVVLQFDADQITSGSPEEQAEQAIALINVTLGKEPFSLVAQLHYEKLDNVGMSTVEYEEGV